MNIHFVALCATTSAVLLLSGCAAPAYDASLGSSVRAALLQQRVDGGVPAVRGPMAGLDGPAAKSTVDRYEKASESPVAVPNVLTIGIGSGKSQ